MDRGRIVALDTPKNLVRNLPVPYEIRVNTENGHSFEGLVSLTAVKEVVHDGDGTIRLRSADAASTIPALVQWANDSGARLTHLEVTPANLEEVFLTFTGREFRE